MGYVEGVVSKLLIVLRVDMTHQSSSFFSKCTSKYQCSSLQKGPTMSMATIPSRAPSLSMCTIHVPFKKKTTYVLLKKKIKNKHATALWSNFDSSMRGSRPSTKWTTTKRVKLSRELPLHPEMSSTVYPRACVREWGTEYVRPCVQFFSSCTYSFFVGDSCTYSAYVGDRWWVSLISTSQHVHLHLHLHLRLHYIYIYLYYSIKSFKHETSHFLAWHD